MAISDIVSNVGSVHDALANYYTGIVSGETPKAFLPSFLASLDTTPVEAELLMLTTKSPSFSESALMDTYLTGASRVRDIRYRSKTRSELRSSMKTGCADEATYINYLRDLNTQQILVRTPVQRG